MKNNSGKKREKTKATPANSPREAPNSIGKGAGAKSASHKKQETQSIGTTPSGPTAASPLSKEVQEPASPKKSAEAKLDVTSSREKVSHATSKVSPSSVAQFSTKASPTKEQGPRNLSKSNDQAKSPTTKVTSPSAESSWSLAQKKSETKPAAALIKTRPGKRPISRAELPKPMVKVPSLLLEGDLPPSPGVSGPGARYALAPTPLAMRQVSIGGELPEAYGTGRVFLAARDPHWLYVSWDFTTEQQNRFNAQSRDGHLVVKVFGRSDKTVAVPEVHVHPESRDWFVHVPLAETLYQAEIGLYERNGTWRTAAVSQNTFTPPEAPSPDLSAKFATIPPEVSFQQVIEAVQQFVTVSKNEPLLAAVAQATEAQRDDRPSPPTRIAPVQPDLPRTSITRIGSVQNVPSRSKREGVKPEYQPLQVQINPGGEWSEEQTRALTKLIHIDSFRRVWLGSMEITELVRLQLQEEMASMAAAEAKRAIRSEKVPAVPFEVHVSSPAGGEFRKPGKFWFKINAELIIYGATEPDAKVTIAERPIKLRPDGTFSFRFSLPDGRYQLPAVAISSNDEDGREARLEFSRSTEYRGRVEAHPQDAALRPPRGENVR